MFKKKSQLYEQLYLNQVWVFQIVETAVSDSEIKL